MTGRIAYRLLKRKLSGLAERGTNLARDIGAVDSLQSAVSRPSLLIIMLGVATLLNAKIEYYNWWVALYLLHSQ